MTPDFNAASSLRQFGRTFTKRLGLLGRTPYDPSLSLLESRLVFELQDRQQARARELASELGIDKGYLSRTLESLRKRGLVRAEIRPRDRRDRWLKLTAAGLSAFRRIDRASHERAEEVLRALPPLKARTLTESLVTAELVLQPSLLPTEISVRQLRPGDLGWVIGRHGDLYAQEYGWDAEFELLVGEIALSFARKHDPARERAWIAEARGLRAGCVFLIDAGDATAKLRILLVEPFARGSGLGTRLVRECIQFAESRGYRKITLWTNDVLGSARRIYQAEGFRLESEKPHSSFGKDLLGQIWSRPLAPSSTSPGCSSQSR